MKTKVIFTDKDGPYTIHRIQGAYVAVSHRGPHISFSYHDEEGLLEAIKTYNSGVKIEVYDNRAEAYKAITDHLIKNNY